MCGILGFTKKFSRDKVNSMLLSQKHRGPDSTGFYYDNEITLGHNRLSIIDLSNKSNQPFYSNDKRFVLVFNGEIYNYKELKKEIGDKYNFVTKSDTEVLLAAYILYGESCLEKLNGMFSFAIWDTQKKEFFAARDRFGVKPFYYYHNQDSFVFASEIKTIFSFGIHKTPSQKAWANYFSYGSYGDTDETFWNGISQLPGGHFIKKTNSDFIIKKWYHFEKRVRPLTTNEISYEEAKSNYLSLMLKSIELRFRSDVPLGFNVSGGLDSSALLMLVNNLKEGKDITAFTFYTGDKNYDELPWVEEMISQTKNPLQKVKLRPEEVDSLTNEISFHQDEPFGGIPTLAYSKLFKRASEQSIKVLLDGQGVDEQLAGYDYYANSTNTTIQGVKSNPFKENVLSEEMYNSSQKLNYPKHFSESILNLQYRDLFLTKIPRALRFNDRISMAYSTELREPFLDYELVEFAFSLPTEYKIKNGVRKKILRDIISSTLSDNITYAPKRALQTPQREWLGKELKDMVEESIDFIKQTKYQNWFSITEIDYEWNSYCNGKQDSSFHIWQLINFYKLLSQ